MERHAVDTLDTFVAEAVSYAHALTPASGATVVGLSGELGAGKTTFVQTVARTLGVERSVTSPTFVIRKDYELPAGGLFARLVHIDAYRLDSAVELETIGWDTLMDDAAALVCVEWAERIGDALSQDAHLVSIKMHPDDTRTISYGSKADI